MLFQPTMRTMRERNAMRERERCAGVFGVAVAVFSSFSLSLFSDYSGLRGAWFDVSSANCALKASQALSSLLHRPLLAAAAKTCNSLSLFYSFGAILDKSKLDDDDDGSGGSWRHRLQLPSPSTPPPPPASQPARSAVLQTNKATPDKTDFAVCLNYSFFLLSFLHLQKS